MGVQDLLQRGLGAAGTQAGIARRAGGRGKHVPGGGGIVDIVHGTDGEGIAADIDLGRAGPSVLPGRKRMAGLVDRQRQVLDRATGAAEALVRGVAGQVFGEGRAVPRFTYTAESRGGAVGSVGTTAVM